MTCHSLTEEWGEIVSYQTFETSSENATNEQISFSLDSQDRSGLNPAGRY